MTEGRKQNINKSKSCKIGEIKYKQNITCWNCNQKGHYQNQCLKLVASRDKEVNMAKDFDDALVCFIENTVEDSIMDSGLKRRLISVGQLDEEGYHVGFKDQHWKVNKGSLVVARRNKRGSMYMVEVHPEGIGAIINSSGSVAAWFGEAEEAFLYNVREEKKTTENGTVMLKMVLETPLQFGVAERLNRTFRAGSTRLHAEAPKMLWTDSDTKSHQVIRSRDITFIDSIYGARSATDSSSLTKPIQKSQVVLVAILENLAENDNIVLEHGLSSEITQSLGRSSDKSEGSENCGSFEDSGRSDEEYSKDRASSKEGGFETPQVRRSTRESRAPVRYSPSANYLLLTENGEPESYSEALSSKESVQWKKAIIEVMVHLKRTRRVPYKRYKARLMVKRFQQKWGEPSYVGSLNDTSIQHKSKGFDMAEFNKSKWYFSLVFEIKDRCSKKQRVDMVEEMESDIRQKDKRHNKKDKTEHGIGKSGKKPKPSQAHPTPKPQVPYWQSPLTSLVKGLRQENGGQGLNCLMTKKNEGL
ncbi:retrovirus-related pol polyprotein from transposon TNT 1-94 [Tanacetum coccineum]|uniref:Retrovirus-related pol polyprotein from transposon TNT 1-94 n=1 Tax=Tanacetum coccineum TaxID=301880 RepID=A0ABQ4XLM5_9ASTR